MTATQKTGFTLVIFAYNEAATLLETAEKSLRVLEKISPGNGELIIVDDGSTDSTPVIAGQLRILHPKIINIRFEHNRGIGEALKAGYRHASKEFVCAIPADGQFDLNELFHAPVPSPDQIVYFSRRLNKIYRRKRKVLTYLNRRFNKHLLDLDMRDVNWVKIYHTETLKRLELKCSSSIIETEICAKMNFLGMKFVETTSNYLPRGGGVSKGATSKSIARVLKELWKLYLEFNRFKRSVKNREVFLQQEVRSPQGVKANPQ